MARGILISRIALALAVAGGLTGALAPASVAAKAKAKADANYSDGFRKAAAPFEKALTDASGGASGSLTPAQLTAIKAKLDSALGGNSAAALASAEAAATTPDDKAALGQLMRNYGVIAQDPQTTMKGTVLLINSGTLAPEQLGQLNFSAGATAYEAHDYATAARYLKAAKDTGYHDPGNQLDLALADSYRRSGNAAAVNDLATQNLTAARASGGKPSELALQTALQAAYEAKNVTTATDLSAELARDYPTAHNWNSAIDVVRALSSLQAQDNLDLMRLMSRTNSLTTKNDYLEYLQNADPRRAPGEALKVIDAGVSSGKLTSSEIADYRQTANARISADRASLPGLERDARAGNASGVTVSAAADTFLSYDQPAKAEDIYRLALAKPGVDKNRILTRLGIAQTDQGKYADAQQSFAQVTGPRAPVAKLWTAYVATKTAPAAPAAAAPSQ